jgi:hypothetical protein
MREVHGRDTGDDADIGPDSRSDAAAGHADDSRRPAIPTVWDSATRTALALEYRQRVKGTPTASDAGGAASSDDRGSHAHRMPCEGDQVSGPPTGVSPGFSRGFAGGRRA